MKKAIILLAITLPTFCFSQWNANYYHSDQEVAMDVLNKDTIVAVAGNSGRIHRSTNGGQTWTFYQTLFDDGYWDVDFPTNLIGYACGGSSFGLHSEFIAKTMDGGQTWDSLTSTANGDPSFYFYTKIRFVNADTGFVAPMVGFLHKTTDGGSTFTQLPIIDPQIHSVAEIAIKPNQEVFAVVRIMQGPSVSTYSLFKSADLGASWTEVYAGYISKLFFVNNTIGYGVGASGLFLKTTDGGNNWTASFIHPYTNLSGLHFTSENVGYINNAGGIYKTTDGGMNWIVQNLSPPSIISQIQFANDTIGFAISQDGIYRTLNAGELLGLPTLNDENDLIIYPNPATNTIRILGKHDKIEALRIYNYHGLLVKEILVEFDSIEVSKLPNGVYTISIETEMNRQYKQFVKV